jgi:uncharacterized protein with PIN domain
VKFIADSMLGKLARWLRMLGQDVTYSTDLSDSELIELAKKENRILLTKDLELFKRVIAKGIEAFYVDGETESTRLAELSQRYTLKLEVDMENSHCPVCNTKLEATPKEQLTSELEKNTLTYYGQFWKCPNCRQIYWQGAHWKQITNTLNEAKEKLAKLEEKRLRLTI